MNNCQYELYIYKDMSNPPYRFLCDSFDEMVSTKYMKRSSGLFTYCEIFIHVTTHEVKNKTRVKKTRKYKMSAEGPLQGWRQ